MFLFKAELQAQFRPLLEYTLKFHKKQIVCLTVSFLVHGKPDA
jgi:hypothetical protein